MTKPHFFTVLDVTDVHPQVSELDCKSLKVDFVGDSQLRKGYLCYYPSLGFYFN